MKDARFPIAHLVVPLPDVVLEADTVERVLAAAEANPFVESLRRGDRGAIEVLYRQHHEAVRAFARRLLGDLEVAEDLVHDVFLHVPAAFRGYRGDAGLRTFLISIAVQRSRHHVRSAVRRRRALDKLSGELPAKPTAPDEACERWELARRLQCALDQLPLVERVVVVLCEVEERTSIEVAVMVGAREATVRTRLFRAKRRLREILGKRP